MARIIPPANVVLTTRWVIATLIRVWVLLTIVQNAPVSLSQFPRVIERSFTPQSGSPFGGGAPVAKTYPSFDFIGLGEAFINLLFNCGFFAAAAIWAGAIARSVASTSPRHELAKLGIGRLRWFRLTAWWWASVLLRLWALRMIAFLVYPLWSIVSNHLQIWRHLREGGMAHDGMLTTLDVVWHGVAEAASSIWIPLAIAAACWFGAGFLGRFLTRGPAENLCPTCRYTTTATTCPECGTPLSPPGPSNPQASASPAPPHQPPVGGA